MALFWLAAAFVLGIWLGFVTAMPVWLALVATALSIAMAILLRRKPRATFAGILVAVFLLGFIRSIEWQSPIGPNDVGYYNGQTVTLTGYVNSEPDDRDTGNNYVVTIQSAIINGRTKILSGQVEVHTASSQLFDAGDQLRLMGLLTQPSNSASVPYRSILANRGIYSELDYPSAFVVGHVNLGIIGVADEMRSGIESIIGGALPAPESTFLIALLIGAKSAQLGELTPVLIQTGLIHLIAISGIKIAIVAGTIYQFLRITSARTFRLLAATSLLFAYWMISGATVAGLRGSIMWLLLFLATYLGRPTYGLVSLGLAASIMLAITPSLLWDTGFQLTVVGTFAIAVFAPVIDHWLRWLPSFLRASASTTIAAQVGVLPIQVASFHVVAPLSLAANAIVLPFVPLTMAIGFAVVALPHSLLVPIAFGLVHAMIWIATWLAGLPTAWAMTSFPAIVSVGFYALLLALGYYVTRRSFAVSAVIPRGEWLFGLCVAAMGLSTIYASSSPHNGISFPVEGSALITWKGNEILIDGGRGPQSLLAALGQTLGYPNNRLDTVIDATPSAANVASLTAVATNIPVGAVFDPGLEYPTQTYARWRSLLNQRNIPVFALRPGTTLSFEGLTIRCMGPKGLAADSKDASGILMIQLGQHRILYLGSASPTAQQDLAFTGQSVKADEIIASVPVQTTLAEASGYTRLITPAPGASITFK